MSDIHQIIRNIRGRESLSENLCAYLGELKHTAGELSFTDLSLQYLSLYEAVSEKQEQPETFEEVSRAVSDYLEGNLSLGNLIALRKKNIARMSEVSRLIDRFTLAEYLMNRTEHRFLGEKELPGGYSDLDFSDEIMSGISLRKDEARGLLVSEILGELPVRMTKARFFETLRNRLSVYLSSDTEAFMNMISGLRASGGVTEGNEDFPELSRELEDILGVFRTGKGAELTEEEFLRMQDALQRISRTLEDCSGLCSQTAAVLNDLEVLLLSGDSAGISEDASARKILRNTAELFSALPESRTELLDETLELCRDLEGVLEDAVEAYNEAASFSEDLSGKYAKEIQKYGLSEGYADLRMIRALRSESVFPPEPADAAAPVPMNTEIFDREFEKLAAEISDLFAASKKTYSRAVTARMLSLIPPVFKSAEQLENYIYTALSSCSVTEEKLACIELVRKLLAE